MAAGRWRKPCWVTTPGSFTTLHWPAVDWAMATLGIGVTANQNSIPRELVFDVDVMLAGRLDSVPFPFLGADVPEGHQGQSVEGMNHECVLTKLERGLHTRRLLWSFNTDHQPIGGGFDIREDQLLLGQAPKRPGQMGVENRRESSTNAISRMSPPHTGHSSGNA